MDKEGYLEYLNAQGTDPASHKRTGLIMSGPPSTGRPIAAKFEHLVQRFGLARAQTIAHTNKSLFIFPNLVINDILA